MDRRSPGVRVRLRALAFALAIAGLAGPGTASAQVTTDLVDWHLTETTSSWGGGTNFHISSGYSLGEFRWLDTPAKAPVISANTCTTLALYGSATIPVNDTGYKTLFGGSSGTCFVLRGRTTAGSGSMVNHDGRVRR